MFHVTHSVENRVMAYADLMFAQNYRNLLRMVLARIVQSIREVKVMEESVDQINVLTYKELMRMDSVFNVIYITEGMMETVQLVSKTSVTLLSLIKL